MQLRLKKFLHVFNISISCLENFLGHPKVGFYLEKRHVGDKTTRHAMRDAPPHETSRSYVQDSIVYENWGAYHEELSYEFDYRG